MNRVPVEMYKPRIPISGGGSIGMRILPRTPSKGENIASAMTKFLTIYKQGQEEKRERERQAVLDPLEEALLRAKIEQMRKPRAPTIAGMRAGRAAELGLEPGTPEFEKVAGKVPKAPKGRKVYDIKTLYDTLWEYTHEEVGGVIRPKKISRRDKTVLEQMAKQSGYNLRKSTTVEKEKAKKWYLPEKYEKEVEVEYTDWVFADASGKATEAAPDARLDPYWNQLSAKQKGDIRRQIEQDPDSIEMILEMIKSTSEGRIEPIGQPSEQDLQGMLGLPDWLNLGAMPRGAF